MTTDIQQSQVFQVINILYVEDNTGDVAFLVNEILPNIQDPTFDIDIATSIADAKKKYFEKSYDIILLDMNLPNGRGLATVEKVTEFVTSTPIVIMSDLDDETLARRSVKRGVQDYMIKGEFNSRGFKRAIVHALYRFQAKAKKDFEKEKLKSRVIERLRSVSGQ